MVRFKRIIALMLAAVVQCSSVYIPKTIKTEYGSAYIESAADDVFADDYDVAEIDDEDDKVSVNDAESTANIDDDEASVNDAESTADIEDAEAVNDNADDNVNETSVDITGVDFSSRELIVAAEDPEIFTEDTEVVSEYNGVYLTRYKTEEETRQAYIYYYDKSEFVDVNITFSVQDDTYTNKQGDNNDEQDNPGGEQDDDLPRINEGADNEERDDAHSGEQNDALSNLSDMEIETVPAKTIAVIDTGINADDLVGSVSVIGEDTADDNGHGTDMYKYIKSEYPQAGILSVKALGKDGRCKVSDVYAALQYAMESKADIINLSVSAYSTAGSGLIQNTIREAVAQGITVVGAAGNDGRNVKYFIPGNVDEALIVGSCDEKGVRLSKSNYGETVDYNVVSASTSEAAARMSGIIASNDGRSEAGVFAADKPTDDEDTYSYIFEDGEFRVANDPNPDNYYGGASGDKEYVENCGRPGDGEVTYFKYFDKNGSYISGGINTSLYVNGSSQQTNVICIRDARSPGKTGYQFEVNKQVISDNAFRNLAYHAITMLNYNDAHYLLCYYAYHYGSDISGIDLSSGNSTAGSKGSEEISVTGFSGTYDQFIAKYKLISIPENKEFELFYLGYDSTGLSYHSADYFQDFLAWKVTEKNDYYIAIKKLDARSYVMNGVSFNVSYKNNDTGETVNIPGGYFNGKYSGIWTGFMIKEKDDYEKSYRSTDNEGIGTFYLGKFVKEPTEITVTENWHGRTDAGSAWENGKAELVTQKKTATIARKAEEVCSGDYAEKHTALTVRAYGTEAEAIRNVGSYTYTNHHFAYATMWKESTDPQYAFNNPEYSLSGITYGLYGDSSCTELIATVKLTQITEDGIVKGVIKNLTDITINKETTNNNSKPYRVTLDGSHGIGGLMYGDYYWKEISAADSGYILDTSVHKVTLSSGHSADFQYFKAADPMEMGKLRVHKTVSGNAASGASPAGATYKIWSTVFDYEGTITIGADGYSAYKNLVYGTYKIQELTVPTTAPSNGHWEIDDTVYTVTLRKGAGKKNVPSSVTVVADDATIDSVNHAVKEKADYYVAVKKVDGKGSPMDDITFDVYVNGTKQSKQIVTGKDYNGSAYSDGTKGVGSFYLGSFDTAPTVKVTENWADKDYVHNKESRSTSDGTLSIYTSLTSAKSHAADFKYTNYKYAKAVMYKVASDADNTDGNSNYSFTGIKYGLYKSSDNTHIATVTLTQVTENGVTKGIIKNLSDITIVDHTTKNGSLDQYSRVTADGSHCISGLLYDNKYYWKEISVPANSGYEVDESKHEFTASSKYIESPIEIKVTEKAERGKIRVHKLLAGSGASGVSPAGAVYEIKGTGPLSSYSSTFTIGENGYSDYKNLMYGTYTIREKTVPKEAPANGSWTIDKTTYTVTLSKKGGVKTVSSSVAVTAYEATVQSTDTAYQDYYVAVKKVDDEGNTMNGVTFDLTVNGTTTTKALTTGKYVNGSKTSNTAAGIATYYLGSFSSAPKVTIKENWTDNGYVHNTLGRSTTGTSAATKLTLYNTKASAESNAGTFLYTNVKRRYVGICKKDSKGKTVQASFDIYGTNTESAISGGTKLGTVTTSRQTGKASFEVTDYYNSTSINVNGKYRYFYAVETQTEAGLFISLTAKSLTVHEKSLADPDYIEWVNPQKVYAYLAKNSANTGLTDNNPNYSLKGAEYKVFTSRAAAETSLKNNEYSAAAATITVESNKTGKTNTVELSKYMKVDKATGSFKSTTFYIIESKSGKNYLRSTDIYTVTVTGENSSEGPAHIEVTDEPVTVPFSMEISKIDKLTGSSVVPKGKSLEGASFRVEYYAADIEKVLANAKGDVKGYLAAHYTPQAEYETTVKVIKKEDGTYKALITSPKGGAFPIGFITVTEITPPEDYTLDGAAQYITGDAEYDVTGELAFVTYGEFTDSATVWTPKTYHPYTANTLSELTNSTGDRHGVFVADEGNSGLNFEIKVENTPVRGNLRLMKVRYSDGDPIEGVEFEIKNTLTGEIHTIVTDANGNATTAGNKDAWFGLLDDGTTAGFAAGYGSLPTGTYTITEKRCEANKGLQLIKPATVIIDSAATIVVAEADGQLYNIGLPEIKTTATDKATGSKTLIQDDAQTIVDDIKLYHLRADSSYYLVGSLMVKHPDGSYETYMKSGKPYTVISSVIHTPDTWNKSEFEIDEMYHMEFPDVDPRGYEGCSFVVFQKLYYESVPADDAEAVQYAEYAGTEERLFPVLHEDMNDEGQTVRVADIHTTIADSVTGDHIGKSGEAKVTDRVYYTGLTIGEEYTVKGEMHVSGYIWKDADGNELKSSGAVAYAGDVPVGEDDTDEEADADSVLLDADGKPVTAEKTFVAETTGGYIDIEFTYDASLLAGETVVAFETLYYREKVLAVHADLLDEDESVHYPNIHTTLYRGGTEDWAEDFDETDITKLTVADESAKEIMTVENAVVIDRIKYHNLLANRTYIVKGILMDKETGKPLLDSEGNEIRAEAVLRTPEVEAVEYFGKDTERADTSRFICADGTVLDMSADHGDYLVDGYIELSFSFNAAELGGKTAVAFEEIYLLTEADGGEDEHGVESGESEDGHGVESDESEDEHGREDSEREDDQECQEILVNEHKDINDVDQTVRFPEIHTNAKVEETDAKLVPVEGLVTINDTVTYRNLRPGKEYTLTATPVVRGDATGTYEDGSRLLDKEGKAITASITFAPEEADGEVVVPITFEAYSLPEVRIVCFEELSNDKDLEIAVHNDIEDKDQTVNVAKIKTTAGDSETDDHIGVVGENVTIIDKVEYSNLMIGEEYTVKGVLMVKESGEELKDETGKAVLSEVTFTAEKQNGTIDMEFTFDSRLLEDKTIVVFERIYHEGVMIGLHTDIEDVSQTVRYPKLRTKAKDAVTKGNIGEAGGETSIIDTVSYWNLMPGREYTVSGVLMNRTTGEKLLVDGEPVTAEKTFTAEAEDGTIELVFTFDSSGLQGEILVVFENLFYKGVRVTGHTDILDEDQSEYHPDIKTTARDKTTGKHIGKIDEKVTIIDRVEYTNLIAGKEYTVSGTLMDRDTGEVFLVDGRPVTAEKSFTAQSSNGSIELEFVFDGSKLDGKTIVVFEDLLYEGIRVGSHADITDEEQTVYYPAVHTHVEEPYKETQPVNDVKVVDDMVYEGLCPGEKYLIEGVLIDKKTGEAVTEEGIPVVTRINLTPENEKGMIEVPFEFDATDIAGHDVVIYEYIWLVDGDNNEMAQDLVAEHKDINNTDQTFRVSEHPDTTVKTGDDTPVGLTIGMMIISVLGMIVLLRIRKYRGKN